MMKMSKHGLSQALDASALGAEWQEACVLIRLYPMIGKTRKKIIP